jgi:predicted transcriptional regulator
MTRLACTQKEAAEMLGVSISTINNYIKNKVVKSTKVNTRTLVIISSIYKLLNEEEQKETNYIEEYHELFNNMSNEEKVKEINTLLKISLIGKGAINE